MSGVNKVILIGRLGKDPEVRTLESGATVANFSMATTETYKDRNSGERKEITEWHNIVLWRGLAEVASKYLHKGDLLYVEGKLRTRSYEKDGQTKYITEVLGDNMTMLGSKGSGQGNSSGADHNASSSSYGQKESSKDTAGQVEDDLPF